MRALIVKTSSFGDILQSFYAIEYLKEKGFLIDWVVCEKYKDLPLKHPFINKIFIFEKVLKKSFFSCIKKIRKNYYDVVFDLQGNCKSGLITLFAKSKKKVGYQLKNVAEWPNILSTNIRFSIDKNKNIRLQYLDLLKKFFQDETEFYFKKKLLKVDGFLLKKISISLLKSKKVKILIAPFSKWQSKELKISFLIDFLKLLEKKIKVFYVFISGSEEEEKKVKILQENFKENSLLLKNIDLAFLQHIIKKLDIAIAVDSCILHLLDFVPIISFSIFGPTSHSIYKPIGKNHFFYQSPCIKKEKFFFKKCKKLRKCHNGCLNLDPKKVFQKFEQILKEKKFL